MSRLADIFVPERVLRIIDITRILVSYILQEGIANHPEFKQIQNPSTHIFGTVESFAKLFGTLASNTGLTQASNINLGKIHTQLLVSCICDAVSLSEWKKFFLKFFSSPQILTRCVTQTRTLSTLSPPLPFPTPPPLLEIGNLGLESTSKVGMTPENNLPPPPPQKCMVNVPPPPPDRGFWILAPLGLSIKSWNIDPGTSLPPLDIGKFGF